MRLRLAYDTREALCRYTGINRYKCRSAFIDCEHGNDGPNGLLEADRNENMWSDAVMVEIGRQLGRESVQLRVCHNAIPRI